MERILPDRFLTNGAFILGLTLTTAATSLSIIDGVVFVLLSYILLKSIRLRTFGWITSVSERRVILFFGLLVLLSLLFLPFDSTGFGIITIYLIAVYFLSVYLKERNLRDVFLRGYVVGALFASLLGIVTVLLFSDTALSEIFTQDGRLLLFYSDANVFGAFLIPALILTLSHFFESRETDEHDTAIHFVSFALILSAILLTDSRGAYVQCFIALLIFVFLERRHVRQALKHAGVLLVILILLPSLYLMSTGKTDIFVSRLSGSIIPRIENFYTAKDIVLESDARTLLIGSGNGSYEHFSQDGFSAHNTFIRLLVENGIAGLLTFVSFLAFIIYRLFKENRDVISHALLASILGILLHSIVIDTLHWRHLWLLLGFL